MPMSSYALKDVEQIERVRDELRSLISVSQINWIGLDCVRCHTTAVLCIDYFKICNYNYLIKFQ